MSAHTFALRLEVLRFVMASRKGDEAGERAAARAIAVLSVADSEVREALAFVKRRVLA